MVGTVGVIKEQLLACFDVPRGKNANAMLRIDDDHLCVTVRILRVVRKAYEIALSCCIDVVVVVEL